MTCQTTRTTVTPGYLSSVFVWLVGILAASVVYYKMHDHLINVVNYAVVDVAAPQTLLSLAVPLLILAVFLYLVFWYRQSNTTLSSGGDHLDTPQSEMTAACAGIPLIIPLVVSVIWLLGVAPDFIALTAAIVGFSWSIDRLGSCIPVANRGDARNGQATIVLVAVLLASTIWHTFQQVNYWQHFLLGYADFGLFTTELEHCLPWKDVGTSRFSDTRMAYHFIPMFYLLVPFYAVFRSPIFLMAVGTFVLNLAAIPFYQLAKQQTGSSLIGLLVGLAWLALPSISRLPYSSTYGFQSIYLAVPCLAWAFSLAMQGRWRGSHLCLVAAMLCEETVCGVALGWGVYLVVWSNRRRDGVWIVTTSILYLLLCTAVLIPAFEGNGEYTRLKLFGDLSFAGIFDRLIRPRVPLYLLALVSPIIIAAFRHWRMLIVILPTLGLVLLMQEMDYLSIKFWHHSSLLPVLFVAATMGVCCQCRKSTLPVDTRNARATYALGPVLGLVVGISLFHFWMGSSPFSQFQRYNTASSFLQTPDPRMAAVDFVRQSFSPEETIVIATERMAAHFIDYRMVHPLLSTRLSDTTDAPHILVIDRSDQWDNIVRVRAVDQTLSQAVEAGYAVIREIGPVLVMANKQARAL